MMFFFTTQVQQDVTDLFAELGHLIAKVSSQVDLVSSVLWSCGVLTCTFLRILVALSTALGVAWLISVRKVGHRHGSVDLFITAYGWCVLDFNKPSFPLVYDDWSFDRTGREAWSRSMSLFIDNSEESQASRNSLQHLLLSCAMSFASSKLNVRCLWILWTAPFIAN